MAEKKQLTQRELNDEGKSRFIPVRFIINIILILLETLLAITAISIINFYFNWVYIFVILIQLTVAIRIIGSEDSPEYKVPWLFFVMLLPIGGFMLYFMFYSRKLSKSQTKKLKRFSREKVKKDDTVELSGLESCDPAAFSQANLIKKLAECHVYGDTENGHGDRAEKQRLYGRLLVLVCTVKQAGRDRHGAADDKIRQFSDAARRGRLDQQFDEDLDSLDQSAGPGSEGKGAHHDRDLGEVHLIEVRRKEN